MRESVGEWKKRGVINGCKRGGWGERVNLPFRPQLTQYSHFYPIPAFQFPIETDLDTLLRLRFSVNWEIEIAIFLLPFYL